MKYRASRPTVEAAQFDGDKFNDAPWLDKFLQDSTVQVIPYGKLFKLNKQQPQATRTAGSTGDWLVLIETPMWTTLAVMSDAEFRYLYEPTE